MNNEHESRMEPNDRLDGAFGAMTRGYVEARGLQLHYAAGGSGDQTIVFIHEVPRSWTQFGPALAHVERFAKFIAIDLPGYGNSDEHERRLTAFDYAEIVAIAISQITSDSVWIAGVHSGALFATAIAARQLIPVRGLLLTGLPMFGTVVEPPEVPAECALGETADGGHIDRILPHFQNKWDYFKPTHRYHDAALAALQSTDRMYAGYRAVFECEAAELLPSIECEVHFLSAEEDGLYAHDQAAAAAITGAIAQLARGIGRDVPWEAPRWYARQIYRAINGGLFSRSDA